MMGACILTGIICLVFGAMFGLVIGSCLRVAGKADEQSEKMLGNRESESCEVSVTPEEYLKSQESNKKHTPYMAESKFAGMTDKEKNEWRKTYESD